MTAVIVTTTVFDTLEAVSSDCTVDGRRFPSLNRELADGDLDVSSFRLTNPSAFVAHTITKCTINICMCM